MGYNTKQQLILITGALERLTYLANNSRINPAVNNSTGYHDLNMLNRTVDDLRTVEHYIKQEIIGDY